MLRWKIALAIAVPTSIALFVLAAILLIVFLRRGRLRKSVIEIAPASGELRPRRFDWSEHPPLVSAAVENGWAGFSFAVSAADSDARRSTETGWEIGPGSNDLMQRVSLNPGVKDGVRSVVSVRTVLPLPGPPLGPLFFPREAYWEVTVLPGRKTGGRRRHPPSDGERMELMPDGSRSDERESVAVDDGVVDDGEEVVWLGMAAPGVTGFRFPGAAPGSIGFSSTGAVYLDVGKICYEVHGEKIYPDSDKKSIWGGSNSVAGCGFDPSQRRLYFTVDSVLMRSIQCEWDIYNSPLYPTLAVNFGVSFLVNLGQSQFRYRPANAHRTPDPCFSHPGLVSPKASSIIKANPAMEDSGELFSMGRIDPQWMSMSVKREGDTIGGGSEWDDSDFFEIVLDPRI